MQCQVTPEAQLAELSDYLRVEACVRGFSFLCQRLFGVTMVPVPLQPGMHLGVGRQLTERHMRNALLWLLLRKVPDRDGYQDTCALYVARRFAMFCPDHGSRCRRICRAGEGWADGISKYALEDMDHGILGHIYLDLLPR